MRSSEIFLTSLILLLSGIFRGVFCFQLRAGNNNDVAIAKKILIQEKMNPLSLKKENLLVANDDDSSSSVLGFGQIRPLNPDFAELASLYVIPEKRNQGIGGALVQALLERHSEVSPSQVVCLLTLGPTASFYEKYGFKIASKDERERLPSSLQFEYKAGTALSFFLGNDLICMIQ